MNTFRFAASLLLTGLWLTAPAAAQDLDVDRLITVRSATKAVLQAVDELSKAPSLDLVAGAQKAIADNRVKHKRENDSRDLLRSTLRQGFAGQVNKDMERITRQMSVGVKVPLQLTEVRANIGNLDDKVEEAIKKFNERYFEKDYFQAARKKVVDAEWERVDAHVGLPPFKQVNDLLNKEPRFEACLPQVAGDVRRQVASYNDLFEENVRKVDAKVTTIVNEVGAAYQKQCDLAKAALEATPASQGLGTKIAAAAKASATAQLGASPRPYALFDAIKLDIDNQAKQLEQSRWGNYLGRCAVPLKADWLHNLATQNLGQHFSLRTSQIACTEAAYGPTVQAVASNYAAQCQCAGDELPQAAARFASSLSAEPLATLWRRRVAEWVGQSLPGVRQSIAAAQVRTSFPTIESWQPSVELLARLYERGTPVAFTDWLNAAKIPSAAASAQFLEETQQQVIGVLSERSARGLTALRAQLEVVREMEKDAVLVRDLAAAILSGSTKKSIITEWRQIASTRWSLRAAAHAPYKELLPRANEEIDRAVGVHFDAVQQKRLSPPSQPVAATATATAGDAATVNAVKQRENTQAAGKSSGVAGGGGGGGAGGGGGGGGGGASQGGGVQRPDNGEGIPPDCTIALSLKGNRLGIAQFESHLPVAGVSPAEYEFDPLTLQASGQQLAASIGPRLMSILTAKVRSTKPPAKPELGIHIRDTSPEISHHLIMHLRSSIEAQCRRSDVPVRWSESF